MALAQYFDEGTLYPELYEDGFYGGTRYMPVPIVLHGFLAELTGEYLLSGKLLSYAAMIGLLAAMFVLLRRQGCPVAIALALPALILTTRTGLAAGMDIRGDALPLLLQVLAVGIVAGTARPAPTVAAAALAAIALLSKTSAVWAPVAIAIWLVGRDRRRLAVFLVAYVGIAGSLVLLFTILTQGRMLENVLGLSTSGITGLRTVLLTPYRFVHLIVDVAATAWAVVPLVALAGWISLRRRSASIYVLSLVCALVVTLVVLIDAGTGWNQLIDLVVLSALVIGELVAGVRDDSSGPDRDAAPDRGLDRRPRTAVGDAHRVRRHARAAGTGDRQGRGHVRRRAARGPRRHPDLRALRGSLRPDLARADAGRARPVHAPATRR